MNNKIHIFLLTQNMKECVQKRHFSIG